ncbi:MAG: amidophosphoribosyltransferase [Parvularculales bacterium]
MSVLREDRLHEDCGVFGVFNHPDAAALSVLGLHALQHRGQEAAGIVSFDGTHFNSEKRPGLVGDHFSDARTISRLPGRSAVGHVRYSTIGGSVARNIQPLFADLVGGGCACAHNGHFTNAVTLRNELVHSGAIFQSTCDTETFLHLLARSPIAGIAHRIVDSLRQIEGAFAMVMLTTKKLVGARDPLGIRPLVLGQLEDAYILASETCALDIIGAHFVRDIEPGEIVIISEQGIQSLRPFPPMKPRPCVFEYIYFARPDSIVGGRSVYEHRQAMGRELARESHNTNTDVVIPVPDSGVPAAIGYASEANMPFELGIIRNHYVGRTFIQPTQQIRQQSVKLKHNTNRTAIRGRRVILIDDSIVRGTTSIKIVQMLYEAGAREIHFRVACPPIAHPDYYGIDTPEEEQLLAAQHNLESMKRHIGVDSLSFLSVDGLYRAMGYSGRDPVSPQFTDHCFTGDYPTPLTDQSVNRHTEQLSLLTEIG